MQRDSVLSKYAYFGYEREFTEAGKNSSWSVPVLAFNLLVCASLKTSLCNKQKDKEYMKIRIYGDR